MPTPSPTHVLAVGRNYAAHAEELGNAPPASPLLFWKPAGCVAREGVCALPRWSEGETRIDFEGEIALVLGRDLGPGTPDLPEDPWDAVAGIAAGVDVSDRDLQKREPQWVRAKGFCGACGLGEVAPRPADPADLRVRSWQGDRLAQDGHTSQLLFPFRDLLRWLHTFLRLYEGDVILTGTPAGVGPVQPGDVVQVAISVGRDDDAVALASVELRFAEGPRVPSFR